MRCTIVELLNAYGSQRCFGSLESLNWTQEPGLNLDGLMSALDLVELVTAVQRGAGAFWFCSSGGATGSKVMRDDICGHVGVLRTSLVWQEEKKSENVDKLQNSSCSRFQRHTVIETKGGGLEAIPGCKRL